jgi:hypothetical protein
MTDYRLSRGIVIYSRDSSNNNKYGIRVIPDMDGIEETNLLPAYPSFFFNSIEVYANGDKVWCLHTEDFQVGYVLGLCENSEGRNLTSFFNKVLALEEKFGLKKSKISNLYFQIHDGVLLDFIDKENDINGRLTTNGSSFLFTSDGSIYLDAGASSLHLNKNGEIDIDSENEIHDVDQSYEIKANRIEETTNIKRSNIAGDKIEIVSGSSSTSVLGNNQESYTKDSSVTYVTKKKELIGTGADSKVISGGSKTTILAGDYSVTLATGNMTLTSALGSMKLIVGPKGLEIISAGNVKITTPTSITLQASKIDLKSLSLKSATSVVGGGAFCKLPFCLFTGAPHTTNSFTGLPI